MLEKVRTAVRVLSEQGMDGVLQVLAEKKRRARAQLDTCEFLLQGLKDEGLRNAFLFGDYEEYERKAVQRYLADDLPIVELGACLGVVSCIANRRLRQPDLHVVVEANPAVIPFLKRNRRHNRCRFQVLNRAIAYDTESIEYAPTDNFAGNSLGETRGARTVSVPTTSLAQIVERRGFERFTLICDIEGHERQMVAREGAVLQRADVIVMETHARLIGEAANAAMLAELTALGFAVLEENANVVVLRNTAR